MSDELHSLREPDVLHLQLMATVISYLLAQREENTEEMAKYADEAIVLVIKLDNRLMVGGFLPSHWRAAR